MNRLSKFFVGNIPLKIGAVIVAALLWFHTITEKTYEYNFEIKKSVIKLPDGYRLAHEDIPNVEVRLSGSGKSLLECFDENALYLDIDLTGFRAGTFEYPVEASNIILPQSDELSVEEVVFPKFIRLEMVKKS
jgi:hypothetical protein